MLYYTILYYTILYYTILHYKSHYLTLDKLLYAALNLVWLITCSTRVAACVEAVSIRSRNADGGLQQAVRGRDQGEETNNGDVAYYVMYVHVTHSAYDNGCVPSG